MYSTQHFLALSTCVLWPHEQSTEDNSRLSENHRHVYFVATLEMERTSCSQVTVTSADNVDFINTPQSTNPPHAPPSASSTAAVYSATASHPAYIFQIAYRQSLNTKKEPASIPSNTAADTDTHNSQIITAKHGKWFYFA